MAQNVCEVGVSTGANREGICFDYHQELVGDVHASEYLKAYMYDMTEEVLLDALFYTGKVRNVGIKELMDKYKNLHIYFQVQPLGFDLGNAIRIAQAKSKRPLYVLMEHYIGTDKNKHAEDFAFVQQVAQETHVPITLIQYNNEVF